MKRVWMSVLVLAALAGAAYFAFSRYKIEIAGFVAGLRDPIGPTQQIAWAAGPAEAPVGERPPNIIVIVADDLGFNDISFNGGGFADGSVTTPSIDAIGREGASFEAGYAANATCSPSRAAIMTGRYPTRFGFEYTAVPIAFARNIATTEHHALRPPIYHADRESQMPDVRDMGVPSEEITIAEVLRDRGYQTLHIGKWHLGEATGLRPEDQGFNESLGFMAGASMYTAPGDGVDAKLTFDPIDRYIWAFGANTVQWNGGQRFRAGSYMTDYLSDQAVSAIEANRNRPFFLYLAYNAPHTPLQATREDYDALAHIEDHTERVYGAMLRALDRGIGRVMQSLCDQGIDDNTIVIFTSDNGGAWYTGLPDLNRPYRGWKATFFEGGVRVPYFLRWPGHVAPGQRIATPVGHLDVFATAAAAAQAPLPNDRPIDSVNLLPFAQGQQQGAVHEALFWRSGDYRAVRVGDWKLQVSENPERMWLFNLAADPYEHDDLSAREPEHVRELRALIEAQNAAMPAPLWPNLLEGAVRIDVPLNAPWTDDQEYVYWAN